MPPLRLLIVTAWYHPFIHPRAHRWTSLAEHWAAQGWEVHVVCARRPDCLQEAEVQGVFTHRAGFDSLKELWYHWASPRRTRGRVGQGPRAPHGGVLVFNQLYRTVWGVLPTSWRFGLWVRPATNRALRLLQEQPFDALITVSMPFSGQLVGQALKKRYPQLRWLADIGDPLVQSGAEKPLSRAARLEKAVLEQADAVVVTTEFTRSKYRDWYGRAAVEVMEVIPPLLHPPPVRLEKPGEDTNRPFRLGYFGALYRPVRTPDAFLDLLGRTLAVWPAGRPTPEIHFYGEIFPEFYRQLKEHPAIRLYGLRPRAEIQAAMAGMDALLNIGNQSDFQLPSKAVDYLAAGRPVVNLSYTQQDPFAAFFGDDALLINLTVRSDQVEEESFRRWMDFLHQPPPAAGDLQKKIAPFLIGAIARAYQDRLKP